VKGMVFEVEYLPQPVIEPSGSPELLLNFLSAIIPVIKDLKVSIVIVNQAQWNEVLGNELDDDMDVVDDNSDIFIHENNLTPVHRQEDWTGVERDRRSAYLIYGALKLEGILP